MTNIIFLWQNPAAKVLCLTVLERLVATDHSLALSHYWLTWGLLAAEFPPWPSPPLLSQPDPSWLPRWVHVDASLSADTGSTWTSDHQESPPQAIQQNLPPSSWITRACHSSRLCYRVPVTQVITRLHGADRGRQGPTTSVITKKIFTTRRTHKLHLKTFF